MDNDNIIKNYIQSQLQSKVASLEYDLSFNGEVGFYDHKWLKKNAGIKITPFVLTPVSRNVSKISSKIETIHFVAVFMCFADKKEESIEVLEDFINDINTNPAFIDSDNNTLIFKLLNKEQGVDFIEGSGDNTKRFEYAIEFEVTVGFELYGQGDLTLEVSYDEIITPLEIPIKTLKFEHGNQAFMNKANTEQGYSKDTNIYYNTNGIIVECFATKDIIDFIQAKQHSVSADIDRNNRVYELLIKIAGDILYQQNFNYDGFVLAVDNAINEPLTIFLYFTIAKENTVIKINDVEIPIMNYSIGMQVAEKKVIRPNDNVVRHKETMRMRSYVFEVAEENGTLLSGLYNKLLDDEIDESYYTLEMKFVGSKNFDQNQILTWTKNCILQKIEKNPASKNRGSFVLTLLDGEQ